MLSFTDHTFTDLLSTLTEAQQRNIKGVANGISMVVDIMSPNPPLHGVHVTTQGSGNVTMAGFSPPYVHCMCNLMYVQLMTTPLAHVTCVCTVASANLNSLVHVAVPDRN